MYAVLLTDKSGAKLGNQFPHGHNPCLELRCLKTVQAALTSGAVGHLMQDSAVEALAIDELLFQRHHDVVL